jgi:hypothetical protein
MSYSVDYLHQAYNILNDQGHDAFRRFVNRVKMPTGGYMTGEDIERVLNKYNYNKDPEFKAKIDAKVRNIKNKMKNFGGPSQRVAEPDNSEVPF